MNDPLSDLLRVVGLSGSLISRARLGGAFGVRAGEQRRAVFHVPVEGQAWIALDEGPAHLLEVGDVGVVTRGGAHRITDRAGRACQPIGSLQVERTPGCLPVVVDGNSVALGLLCGTFAIGAPADRWLLEPMPDLFVVRGAAGTASYLRATLQLLDDEVAQDGLGGALVRDRLVEVLVMQILRRWAATLPEGARGWFAGLSDPELGPLMAAVHADPALDWSLDRMARVAGLSRTSLARRFRERLDLAPHGWVADWRLAVARRCLHNGSDVASAATQAGFSNEASFSRAFKRAMGQSPAAFGSEENIGSTPLELRWLVQGRQETIGSKNRFHGFIELANPSADAT